VEPKLFPETSQHGQGEVRIGDRIADVGEVVGDRLQTSGVDGDRHVPARRVAELFAEEDVLGCAVGVEEVVETCPGGARAAVGALDEAKKIVGERAKEPQGDVDVIREPFIRGGGRRGALRDMIQALVHGEEEGEDLLPAGEVGAAGGDLEVDVRGDVDVADAEARRSGSGQGGKGVGVVVDDGEIFTAKQIGVGWG
jgi:hypothetical protein